MTETTVRTAGTLVVNGNGDNYYASFRVGVADGEGGTRFGSETTVSLHGGFGRDLEDATVAVGGIGGHDTTFARQRASAYLLGADIADQLTDTVRANGGRILDAFITVARDRGLEVHEFTNEETGRLEGAEVWEA